MYRGYKRSNKVSFIDEGKRIPSNVPVKENIVYRIPDGVIGMILPWDWPLYLSMRGVAPAIAADNSVVLKVDSQTPVTGGFTIAKIFETAGLPKGVLSVIVAESEEMGYAIIEHPIPRVISYTGSTTAGRKIAEIASKGLKKLALELDGNNALIVLDDANVDEAVSAAAFGRFLHQGQICISTNRIIVDRKIYNKFVDKLTKLTKKIKVGDPNKPNTIIGPMINQKQVDRLMKVLDECTDEGAKIVLRGNIVKGTLVEPSVVIDVTNNMTIAQTELFGPVAFILPVACRWRRRSDKNSK